MMVIDEETVIVYRMAEKVVKAFMEQGLKPPKQISLEGEKDTCRVFSGYGWELTVIGRQP